MRSRGTWPLVLGTVAGLVIAVSGVAKPAASLPNGAVAVVDGQVILRGDLERALSAVAADRRDGVVTPEIRRRVLERLIDEELLIARGLSLGLGSRDPRVRAELVSAMLDLISRTGDEKEASEAELLAFYQRDPSRFAKPAWVHVRAAWFAGDLLVATERARVASASGGFAQVQAAADLQVLPIPDGPIPLKKLADYLGAEAAQVAISSNIGELSQPIAGRSGVWVLELVSRENASAPPFAEVYDEVKAALRREVDERKLHTWFEQQRAVAKIVVSP